MQLNLFVRDVQSDQIIPVKVVPAGDLGGCGAKSDQRIRGGQ